MRRSALGACAPAAEHALYPRLNHMFENVEPDGLDAHVDVAVIERIAAFVACIPSPSTAQ